MATIPAYRGKGGTAKSYPALSLTKKDPKLAAMVSKVERSPYAVSHDADGNRRNMVTNASAFRSMLQKRGKRNIDAANIIKLLPDIELSAQILTSSILSPKDMMTMELIYSAPKSLLSAELTSAMVNCVKTYFEEDYRIQDKLADMVREPLFEKGAYAIAVIPENAIDEIINGTKRLTMESLQEHFTDKGTARNIGILGPHTAPEKVSKLGIVFEDRKLWTSTSASVAIDNRVHYRDEDGQIAEWKNYVAEDYLIVVDNPNVLKVPKLNALSRADAVSDQYTKGGLHSAINTAMEAMGDKLTDMQVERAIYRTRQHAAEPIVDLKHQHELQRKSVGNPLIMKLPSESVLPAHVPGDVKKHIGYFILLDEEGNPISASDGDHMHPGLASGAASSVSSNLIKKVSMNMGTGDDSFDPMNAAHIDFAQQIYSDMIERDLIRRVKNGVSSSSVAIARNEEVYRLMLSRVLAKKYTQILYLPMEYMTYIAFKYGDDGIGRSMLDDQSMINTLRSVLLFSDVMGSVKNSIGRTKVNATIPDTDPNPLKTLEMAQDEIVRSRQLGIPLGVSNPADIMEFIQRAGFEWEISGHKGLPDLKFEFQQVQSSYSKPDSDLVDHLRKSSIMGFGLSPETVDNGFNAEFATTAVANNILLSKRVVMWQDILTPQLSDHLRKVAANTEDLTHALREILENNYKGINLQLADLDGVSGEEITEEVGKKLLVTRALNEFISGFMVTLPRPSSVTLENQVSELKAYSDALEEGLNSYVTSDLFAPTVTGEISNEANTVRALLKAYFMRKYMAEKNVLNELADLVTADENGKPQLLITEQVKSHLEAMTKAGVMTLVSLQPNKLASDADLKALGITVGDNADTGDTSSDSGGDDFGGGDMGFGDMGADAPAEDGVDSTDETEEEPKADEETTEDKPEDASPVI